MSVTGGHSCPTADCKEGENTEYCDDDADCPAVTEDVNTCPGHTVTYTYCDNSHNTTVITFERRINKEYIEDFLFILTDRERETLELGLSVLRRLEAP